MLSGNWNNAANAGVGYRNLNNYRSNDNNNASFRAVDYFFKPDATEVDTGDIGITPPANAKYAESETELYSLSPTLENIARLDVLHRAFLNASKGKRNKKAVYEFENNLSVNLEKLRVRILLNSYTPDAPRKFMVTEPKLREIAAPSFRDSVVQHAIYMLVYPLFDAGFIHDSYGCRKHKGTHRASDALQKMMRKCDGNAYFLQLDIRKYYYNIPHDLLKERLERKIDDKDLVDLMMRFAGDNGKGLFIGNLLSQLYGLIYLDRLDHWIKRVKKQKHYVRYVDDFIVVGLPHSKAKELKYEIEQYLKEKMHLELSKFHIQKIKKGINFVGFRTWRTTRYVRKRSLHNFNKALKNNKITSLVSIIGNTKRTATYAYFQIKIKEHNDLQMQTSC